MVIDFYLDSLRSIPLFQELREDVLLSAFYPQDYRIAMYEKGELVHLALEQMESFDVLLEGALLGAKKKGESIKAVRRWRAGALIGAEFLFAQRNHIPLEVTASQQAVVLHMDRELVIRLCTLSEHFLRVFLPLCSDSSFSSGGPPTRLRQQILDFLELERQRHKSPVIRLMMTKKEMARRMGVHYRSLFRELSKLRDEGRLEYDKKSITWKGDK